LHAHIISGLLSRWGLETPQIREYYNWSLECNYAGRGTELYNIGEEDLKCRFEHASTEAQRICLKKFESRFYIKSISYICRVINKFVVTLFVGLIKYELNWCNLFRFSEDLKPVESF
jgi:hypothetical protein